MKYEMRNVWKKYIFEIQDFYYNNTSIIERNALRIKNVDPINQILF